MEVKVLSSQHLKSAYNSKQCPEPRVVRLSVFDEVTDDAHIAAIFAFRPPNPTNFQLLSCSADILMKFPEWGGRIGKDADGNPAILLDGPGVRFVEAEVDSPYDKFIPSNPSPVLLELYPSPYGVDELSQLQLTRFSCGTLAVGAIFHHKLGNGNGATQFLVSWARACCGLDVPHRTVNNRHVFFPPRNPPEILFEHRGVEYKAKGTTISSGYEPTQETVVHKARFSKVFLQKLKIKAGSQYSTFVCLMAHLWRTVTKARGLDGDEIVRLRIAVDGRSRLSQKLPKDYIGNVVLWAFCRSKASDLVNKPLKYAANIIYSEIARVNNEYFRSFIDFANSKAIKEEGLEPVTEPDIKALYPDMDVYSWLGFPVCSLDFGCGSPFCFIPPYMPLEGLVFIAPLFQGDNGSIDAYVSLFEHHVDAFKQMCYSLEDDDGIEMPGNCPTKNISRKLGRL